MKSLKPAFLGSLKFRADETATLTEIGQYRGKQELYTEQIPQVLESLRRSAIIEASESSNRIEGITAPKHRIQRIVDETTEPKNSSEQEIAGYRDALNLIHESAKEMPFTTNVILQVHKTLYSYLSSEGGHWKMTDNEIVKKDSEGNVTRIRFKPVTAVSTPQAMEDLTTFYRRAQGEPGSNPLVLIPLAILDFLCIHPFTDGNGRAARLITLMLLYQSGYEVGRFISLERMIEESKDTYYGTLEASSQGWHEGRHDSHPWLRYFWGTLLKAYGLFQERVDLVDKAKGSKAERVRYAVNNRNLPFSISELQKDCPGISKETVRNVLQEMRDEGLLELKGKGRGSRWVPVSHTEPSEGRTG